ncbi:S1 family peptidase [Streptosporangium sp. NPDC087985]|uniref:S1 family peptidase n=1 Tax=Streptosporangium sp. NPDC087985 TaxID=3366196 RepID=UPI00382DE5D7
MFRRRASITGCALTIIALVLTAVPAAASSPRTGTLSAKPPPGMLEALQRDLGLSAEHAQARLLNEIRLTPIATQLRRRLGTRFAGSWLLGPTAQTLVVATTDPADIPQITIMGARAKVVGRSLTDLQVIKKRLDDVLPRHPRAGSVRYIDTTSNEVVVLAEEPRTAQAIIKAVGVDTTAVKVVPSTERPRLLSDLIGGQGYFIGATSRCSTGFSVIGETQKGFISAGHCGKPGTTTAGFNRAPQGVFQASTFPESDYAFIAVNADWTLTPQTDSGGGDLVSVAGSRVAIEGASVCRSGSTSGWHCGLIQQADASVTYPQGNVFGLTRTNVCAEPGDSGGPFISIDQAQGITSGGSGDCTSGGVTYFQPVNEILTTYDLALVTTAGNPPPLSTGTCTGYPNTVTGTLSRDQSVYQPNNRYYRSATGTHFGCLEANDGVDFDLYLEKRSGSGWLTVATAVSPNPGETIRYIGAPGYYRYRVVAASGSGPYALGYTAP